MFTSIFSKVINFFSYERKIGRIGFLIRLFLICVIMIIFRSLFIPLIISILSIFRTQDLPSDVFIEGDPYIILIEGSFNIFLTLEGILIISIIKQRINDIGLSMKSTYMLLGFFIFTLCFYGLGYLDDVFILFFYALFGVYGFCLLLFLSFKKGEDFQLENTTQIAENTHKTIEWSWGHWLVIGIGILIISLIVFGIIASGFGGFH